MSLTEQQPGDLDGTVHLSQGFVEKMRELINFHGLEKYTNEPDRVTAEFLTRTLEAYIGAKRAYKKAT